MYFKANACKVAVHKCKPLDQSSTSWEGEGTILYVKKLIDSKAVSLQERYMHGVWPLTQPASSASSGE